MYLLKLNVLYNFFSPTSHKTCTPSLCFFVVLLIKLPFFLETLDPHAPSTSSYFYPVITLITRLSMLSFIWFINALFYISPCTNSTRPFTQPPHLCVKSHQSHSFLWDLKIHLLTTFRKHHSLMYNLHMISHRNLPLNYKTT